MAYTDIDKPSDYFETILFTGNGSNGHAISGLDFQPDWVWLKNRNTTNTHEAFDSVRGATKTLYPDRADAEYVNTSGSLTSFNSDGFTVGSGDGANKSGSGIASWNWKAGTSFTNDASATGIGTIDSTGSVNQDAGFSICSYTGTGSAGTIKHGLSSAPKMIIIKNRSQTNGWITGHQKLDASNPWHKYIELHSTNAVGDLNTIWNDTAPTSSLFTVGTEGAVNNSGNNFIAYCFADVKGYSKFGSYTGNGNADGTFVYTGFKPAWVMVKRSNNTQGWYMLDNKRNTFNPEDKYLEANDSDAEATFTFCDFLSNGFKARVDNTGTGFNFSGDTYIYMAFAEEPFVTSTGVPTTAR